MRRVQGSHQANIKNRSSKHLLLQMGFRDINRCLSNEQLQRLAAIDDMDAKRELNRRNKKNKK